MIPRGLALAMVAVVSMCLVHPSAVLAQEKKKADELSNNISGTYSFLHDGEFVQVTVEDGQVSGYVSRFGNTESDKDQFIDQFFDTASLKGNHLSFKTKTVHGVWYDFSGDVATTGGKQPNQEGYRVIKGTLVEHASDAKGSDKARQRQAEFKSFPSDIGKP